MSGAIFVGLAGAHRVEARQGAVSLPKARGNQIRKDVLRYLDFIVQAMKRLRGAQTGVASCPAQRRRCARTQLCGKLEPQWEERGGRGDSGAQEALDVEVKLSQRSQGWPLSSAHWEDP